MRYVTKSGGDLHLVAVSFGAEIECEQGTCKEYTGPIPSGYASLDAWYAEECERLYRWTVTNGLLTLDASAQEPTSTDMSQLDAVYPIGSVYLTTSSIADPSILFGGTWTQLVDAFPEPVHAWQRTASEIIFAENETVEKKASSNAQLTWVTYNNLLGYDKARVVFDGVTYECPITWTDDGFEQGFYLGNYAGLAPEYPFGIHSFSGLSYSVLSAETGTHTITFSVIL